MDYETEDKLLTKILLGSAPVPAIVLMDKTMSLAYGVLGWIGLAAGAYMFTGVISAALRTGAIGIRERIADRVAFLTMAGLMIALAIFLAEAPNSPQ